MFRGTYSVSLDAKGRLAIPARFREHLQSSDVSRLVFTKDPDHCLALYPEPEWILIEQKLRQLPSLKQSVRNLKRLLIGNAHDVDIDAQGRVLLPLKLREYAGLDKRVAMVGQVDRIEVWNEDTWNARCEEWQESIDLDDLTADADLGSLVI
ncbi:mraZ protein [Thioflavicoccus mobilis 8321]|uniref:Transcriptional regulator MraZ n=1 Tax=Thioflavicoccus mobilis 8321 TaxID=765912 RepID=L0H2I8_9GAMM|nr:division/cell wall cluster transcriptional repressor MraZ [Thioflavicoccus mobilis]AGA91804.1 mraZ protein [Thioflavicoccus mobilis 8321]